MPIYINRTFSLSPHYRRSDIPDDIILATLSSRRAGHFISRSQVTGGKSARPLTQLHYEEKRTRIRALRNSTPFCVLGHVVVQPLDLAETPHARASRMLTQGNRQSRTSARAVAGKSAINSRVGQRGQVLFYPTSLSVISIRATAVRSCICARKSPGNKLSQQTAWRNVVKAI